MKKAPLPLAPKTITWFEQAITEATPTTGILAGVDQGIWSITEMSGQLAGIWRRHRHLMQDLDDKAVTQALGELLTAIVQTAQPVPVAPVSRRPSQPTSPSQGKAVSKQEHPSTAATGTRPLPPSPSRQHTKPSVSTTGTVPAPPPRVRTPATGIVTELPIAVAQETRERHEKPSRRAR